MKAKDELGQKAAEFIAEKAYERYGDKVPVDVDAQKIADKAYEIYMHKRDKQKRHSALKIIKTLAMGTLGVVVVVGITAVMVAVEKKKD